MQKILLIAFLILWKFNTNICTYYFPGHETDYEIWLDWYFLRCQIYEWMFLIAVLIPFTKITRWSKAIALFGIVYIGCSVLDKSQGIFNEMVRDYFVVFPLSVAISYMIYHKRK